MSGRDFLVKIWESKSATLTCLTERVDRALQGRPSGYASAVGAVRLSVLLHLSKKPPATELGSVLPPDSKVFVDWRDEQWDPSGSGFENRLASLTDLWTRALVSVSLAKPVLGEALPGLIARLLVAMQTEGYVLAVDTFPACDGTALELAHWTALSCLVPLPAGDQQHRVLVHRAHGGLSENTAMIYCKYLSFAG